jgi:TIR domain
MTLVGLKPVLPASRTPESGRRTGHLPGSRGLVFLSHTSRPRTELELGREEYRRHTHRRKHLGQLLEQLQEQLVTAGFAVWSDRSSLVPGYHIDSTIHRALKECRAAVVLMNGDALDSGYMRREINVLMYRKTVDSLYVLPVLLGVQAEEVRDSSLGRDTGIDTDLALRPSSPKLNQTAARLTAEEITRRLLAESEGWRSDLPSPIRSQAGELRAELENVRLTLVQTARYLGQVAGATDLMDRPSTTPAP